MKTGLDIGLEKNLEHRINRLLSEKRFEWDLEELIDSNMRFPDDEFPSNNSSDDKDDRFDTFLKKFNWLLNLQFYYSIKVIKTAKRKDLAYFLRMYLTTQKDTILTLHNMHYSLSMNDKQLINDYVSIPRLEEEIDGVTELVTNQWNKEMQTFSDKEMLGVIEEVGDSVKDPLKKVFGGTGNWINRNILHRHSDDEDNTWSAKNQGKINSGIKYMDEFANIGMRMARGGL